jgi:hypothetical protein
LLSSAIARRPSVRSPPKRRLTCPRVRTPPRSCRGAHLTRVSTLSGSRHQPVSGQLSGTAGGRASLSRPGFLLPFGRRHSLAGSSCSRQGTGLSLRSAYRAQLRARTLTGLPRFAPARYDRGGCPLYPGDGGALPGRMPCPASACRFPAASPCTPLEHPTGGAPHYGASTGVWGALDLPDCGSL